MVTPSLLHVPLFPAPPLSIRCQSQIAAGPQASGDCYTAARTSCKTASPSFSTQFCCFRQKRTPGIRPPSQRANHAHTSSLSHSAASSAAIRQGSITKSTGDTPSVLHHRLQLADKFGTRSPEYQLPGLGVVVLNRSDVALETVLRLNVQDHLVAASNVAHVACKWVTSNGHTHLSACDYHASARGGSYNDTSQLMVVCFRE